MLTALGGDVQVTALGPAPPRLPYPYADGSPVLNDFNRIMTTVFNGASNIAQAGGLACLQDEGWQQMLGLVAFYKENAAILRQTFQVGYLPERLVLLRCQKAPPPASKAVMHSGLPALQDMGFSVYGGEDAPYVWVGFPGRASWDVFAEILERCNIVTTPGSGFGPGGEGFVRASAFGHRENVLEAVQRFQAAFGGKR